ncbi:LytTR family transcriptional regulator [Fibrisoma montanum]|uniref:LytTR family transcriptional regulator n=1 Tax=Fibrisoma montanum TaxID=2305895 RepID=A0A418M802_9BACT|nr:LytTR family DNA-binding domain-containing protein [Fibrisoma montanum]RIV22260.1 LytTR family transcriptional regulator [Fibrisoma montanum]
MVSLFSQPYPIDDDPLRQLRRAAAIGLFIGLFLVVFQPFGLGNWQTPAKLFKIAGFGLVTFVITAFNFIVWQRVFPRQFAENRWTVWREILLVTGNILLIAIGNRFYLEWLLDEGEDSGVGWLGMILITFLIGLFPTTGAVLLSYIARLRKYTRAAAGLPVQVVDEKPPGEALPVSGPALNLVAENEKDSLTFPAADLIYIESSDNYCTVVYLKADSSGTLQPVKPLLRSSLSRLESQINQLSIARKPFVRCHRSFIVNLDRVERVTGNAQGYKLHLLGGQFQIPVARKYNDTLVAELKAL